MVGTLIVVIAFRSFEVVRGEPIEPLEILLRLSAKNRRRINKTHALNAMIKRFIKFALQFYCDLAGRCCGSAVGIAARQNDLFWLHEIIPQVGRAVATSNVRRRIICT